MNIIITHDKLINLNLFKHNLFFFHLIEKTNNINYLVLKFKGNILII